MLQPCDVLCLCSVSLEWSKTRIFPSIAVIVLSIIKTQNTYHSFAILNIFAHKAYFLVIT